MDGENAGSATNRLPGNPDTLNSARRGFSLFSFLSPNPSSSSSSSNFTPTLSANSPHILSHGAKHEIGNKSSNGSFVDSVFGSFPTRIEVENAVAALQSFMQGVYSSRSAQDQFQGILSHVDPTILQSPVLQRVFAAFHLLQTVQSVRRMVTSISSDRAVWNAVLKNNEVQKFQQSLKQGRVCRPQGVNDEEPDLVSILKWFFENMKLKVVELLEVLKSLVSDNFGTPSPWKENSSNPGVNFKHQLEEMICSTVLLSIITLMVVLVNRAYGF